MIIIMHFLKRTLGKQDTTQHYPPKKTPMSSFTKKHHTLDIWNPDIDDLLEKRILKKEDNDFDVSINKIIDTKLKLSHDLTHEEYQNIVNMFVQVFVKHDKVPRVTRGDIQGNQRGQILGLLIKRLKRRGENAQVENFIREVEVEMIISERSEKRKRIEEFDTMVSFKSYKPKAEQLQEKEKEKLEKKRMDTSFCKSHSRSKNSLKAAKSTKDLSSESLKKKTLTKNKSQSAMKYCKLQQLLKDVSVKVVKGNLQYDYSSILEGSKSNIHCRKSRNATLKEESKPLQKKVKKNEAFVFYRPGR